MPASEPRPHTSTARTPTFHATQVCGVRLDVKRSTTDCDGKYRGERYFRCTPGHGLYIPLDDAEFLESESLDRLPFPGSGSESRQWPGVGPPK